MEKCLEDQLKHSQYLIDGAMNVPAINPCPDCNENQQRSIWNSKTRELMVFCDSCGFVSKPGFTATEAVINWNRGLK